LGLIKISFLVTLLKFHSPNRLISASLWFVVVVNILYIFAATFGSVFMCTPIHKYWQPTIAGTCGHRAQYIFGVIGVTIATDVLVTVMPAWILYDLQMPLKNKIGVMAFLSLPIAVTVIGCYRLHTFVVVFSLPSLSAEDPYNVRNALSNIESNLAVIATCGPTIKWLLGRFIPYFDSTRRTSAYHGGRSLRQQRQLRGYQKSVNQKDPQEDELELAYPGGINISKWEMKKEDVDNDRKCTPDVGAEGIKKTTVVQWSSNSVPSVNSVQESRGAETSTVL
jgi:hypothetical protein